jgi:hypothetical protein
VLANAVCLILLAHLINYSVKKRKAYVLLALYLQAGLTMSSKSVLSRDDESGPSTPIEGTIEVAPEKAVASSVLA